MSSITSADKKLLLKDVKTFLDEEAAALKKHAHELELLQQKKVRGVNLCKTAGLLRVLLSRPS